tara:strand:- start:5199 stop:5516 length:318 start_codon:yes stop_codon:yes gene_type:complete
MNAKNVLFFLALLFLLFLNIFDAFATIYWIENGLAIEANPLMDDWLNLGSNYFLTLKLGIVLFSTLMLWKVRNRKLTYFLLAPVFMIYIYVCAKHLNMFWNLFTG